MQVQTPTSIVMSGYMIYIPTQYLSHNRLLSVFTAQCT